MWPEKSFMIQSIKEINKREESKGRQEREREKEKNRKIIRSEYQLFKFEKLQKPGS